MPPLHHPSGNGYADRLPILGLTFLQIATTDKLGAINPNNFLLLGFTFYEELLLWFVPSSVHGSIK